MKKLPRLLFAPLFLIVSTTTHAMKDEKRKNDNKENNENNKKSKNDKNENNSEQQLEKKLVDMPELVVAAKDQNLEKVKELLEKGANPNFMAPFIIPQQQRMMLLRNPALQHMANQDFDHWEAMCGKQLALIEAGKNLEIVKLLLEYGANPNLKNVNGSTAFHLIISTPLCLKSNSFFSTNFLTKISDMIKLYLYYKADLCSKDNNGNTVLHLAVSLLNNLKTEEIHAQIKTLVQTYATFIEKNLLMVLESKFGKAFKVSEFENLKNLFIKHMMYNFMVAKNNKGETAIDIARNKKDNEVVEFLEFYELQDTSCSLQVMILKKFCEEFSQNNN